MENLPNNNLILFTSLSGNTKEVAELIADTLVANGETVVTSWVPYDGIPFHQREDYVEKINECDTLWIGTYTWDLGALPDEMYDVLEVLEEVDLSDIDVHVFGTGDTQFGGDLTYCKANDIIETQVNGTTHTNLKIEQSPRGQQEGKVIKWVLRNIGGEDIEDF